MIEAFPLQWPQHVSRVPAHRRERSRFDVTPGYARDMLLTEIGRMGSQPIISTDQPLRNDGLPYASRKAPEDTGVAVYFTRKGEQVCIACDKYQQVWENMRGITKTIEALRGIERWGSSNLLDQAFKGFLALPSPYVVTVPMSKSWWQILDVSPEASLTEIQDSWKKKVRGARGAELLEINVARAQGRTFRESK